MIKVDDIVKVISGTMYNGDCVEFIPIGTVCKVIEIDDTAEDGMIVDVEPLNGGTDYWYLPNELEKGHMEWVKDE